MFMSTRYKKRDPAWRRRHLFSVEDSLARLFECLTIEYSCGKLISPKYKQFKSQKIDFEQKTRLNNAIWRAWHIQYKLSKRARFFMFDPPFSDQTAHSTPQAVILEGKYWKKRLDTVSTEYKKWRRFYTFKFVSSTEATDDASEDLDISSENVDDDDTNEWNREILSNANTSAYNDSEMDTSDLFMDSFAAAADLPDTLFSSLETQRGPMVARRTIPLLDTSATIIQPTLDMLNPCFDELIDNFDWLAPEWNFGRSLEPLVENPMKEGVEVMNIEESPMLSAGTISTPEKSSLSVGQSSRSKDFSHVQSVYDASNVTGDISVGNAQTKVTEARSPYEPCQSRNRSSSGPNGLASRIRTPSTVIQQSSASSVSGVQQQRAVSSENGVKDLLSRSRTQSLNGVEGQLVSTLMKQSVQISTPTSESTRVQDAKAQTSFYQPHPARLGPYSELPPQLQAPNLTAHLQAALASRETNSIPRNKSDTQLSLLENVDNVRSPPSRKISGLRKEGGRSKRSKITRNVSDSNLKQMEAESTRGGRRQAHRTQSLNNDISKGLTKNFSDSNLVGMTSAHHQRRILPKNYVTIVPLTNATVLPRPTAPVTVPCVPVYPGQGPTYVVNRQPPGNNEPGTARLYMPKVQSAAIISSNADSSLPDSSSSINRDNQHVVNIPDSTLQGQTRLYQLASDGKNILPFTGFGNESRSVPFRSSVESTVQDHVEVQKIRGSQVDPATASSSLSVIDGEAVSLDSTRNADTLAVPKNETDLVMPLQGLSDQQLVSLAKLLQSRDGQQHKQATIAYLELLQQQLNTLLVQQHEQMLKAQKERMESTPVAKTDAMPVETQTPSSATTLQVEQVNAGLNSSSILSSLLTRSSDSPMLPSASSGSNEKPVRAPSSGSLGTGPRIKVTPIPSVRQDLSSMFTRPTPSHTNILTKSEQRSGEQINQGLNASILSQDGVLYNYGGATIGSKSFVRPLGSQLCQTEKEDSTHAMFEVSSNSSGGSVQDHLVQFSCKDGSTQVLPTATETGTTPSLGFQAIGRHPVDKEKKRMSHISAEKRRRGNIKSSFDTLMQMIPSVQNERSAKASKASMLDKAAEYVLYLHRERDKSKEKIDSLTQEITELNTAISVCQNQLPVSGASTNTKSFEEMQTSFFSYLKEKIAVDHKYWIFGLMLKPLFDSFITHVSTGTIDEFINSVLRWLEQHCSLPVLRPSVLSSLRELSTSTSILTDPSQLPYLAARAARSEDPTLLKTLTSRLGTADAIIVDENGRDQVAQDLSSTLETPYAWTIQFARMATSNQQSDPT